MLKEAVVDKQKSIEDLSSERDLLINELELTKNEIKNLR